MFLAALVLARAADAKGPHAVISPGPGGMDPGRAWVATLTLVEYARDEAAAARPTMVLRRGDTRLTVRPRPLPGREPRYRLRVVFPSAGRWSYTLLDGTPANRRLRFPPAFVGDGQRRVTREVLAFRRPGPDEEPLAPEVVVSEPDEGGSSGLWILAGLPFAAAGALALREHRRRSH
jgi:hypothetical protein